MRKLIVLALPAVATLGLVTPASAADVTVHLDVTVAEAVPFTLPTGDCDVSVPAGSNGLAVLDAAVESGCIESYATEEFPPYGAYVSCVNQVCGDGTSGLFLTYWLVYVDGVCASEGISSLTFPGDGDTLGLNYETWVADTGSCF